MEIINSFSKIEYLTIFGTFVYGYVATQFLNGWGLLISNRKRIVFSKRHLAWTFLTFILLIDIWWGSWLKSSTISQHRSYFFLSLLSPLIFYIISTILFPSIDNLPNHDLSIYFKKIRIRKNIAFFCLFISFYLNDTFLLQAPSSDFIFISIALFILIIIAFIKKSWLDNVALVFGFTLLIVHLALQKSFMEDQRVVGGFSINEYLTIFSAFIYGAVASNFFAGWGVLVNQKGFLHNKEYLLWTFFAFGLLIDIWWGQWEREHAIAKDIWKFMLCLMPPIIFYFLSVVIMPGKKADHIFSISDFYARNKRVIYFLFGLIMASNFLVANLMESASLFSSTNILRMLAINLAFMSVVSSNKILHQVVLSLVWLMLMAHVILM